MKIIQHLKDYIKQDITLWHTLSCIKLDQRKMFIKDMSNSFQFIQFYINQDVMKILADIRKAVK